MADQPLLIFPRPRRVAAWRPTPPRGPTRAPVPAAQRDRLRPKLQALEDAWRRSVISAVAGGYEPEQVLVLVIAGSVQDFRSAIAKVPGLEEIAEWDIDELDAEPEFRDPNKLQETIRGRLFLIMFNQEGMDQLLGLWDRFQKNPDDPAFDVGLTKWRDVFRQLTDLRPWDRRDRVLETGLDVDLLERRAAGQTSYPVEVELFFKKSATARQAARTAVRRMVDGSGGRVLREVSTEEIAYEAVIAEMPIQVVEEAVLLRPNPLSDCGPVQTIHPVGQSVVGTLGAERTDVVPPAAEEAAEGQPVVALLDGLPLQEHVSLAGRLRIDDPYDWEESYEAGSRVHGTAMASLILRSELDAARPAPRRPLYVRPILRPDPNAQNREKIPEDVFAVDLVHAAVRRMYEATEAGPAAAPEVKVVNLSVCDRFRGFDRFPSPWARLLDFLAWKYRVLFIVSAGNHDDPVELAIDRDRLHELDPASLEAECLKALVRDARHRRVLAPAESINALTVASVSADTSRPSTTAHYQPMQSAGLPALHNKIGFGFRRSIKPEILLPGGRQLYAQRHGQPGSRAVIESLSFESPPGQRVAAPGGPAGGLARSVYTRGTSNAAALGSRHGWTLLDVLDELRRTRGDEFAASDPALFCKALLVHGAAWRDSGATLAERLEIENALERKSAITRLLGFGVVDPGRMLRSTDECATLLGFGDLSADEADLYRVPLPADLRGVRVKRRVTVSLAWFSPINPHHHRYRQAQLLFDFPKDTNDEKGLAKLGLSRADVDWQAAKRGTIQHEIFEGDQASVFDDGDALEIRVSCRAEAGELQTRVPYALVVTLEAASGLLIPLRIHEQVRAGLQVAVPVGVRPTG